LEKKRGEYNELVKMYFDEKYKDILNETEKKISNLIRNDIIRT